MSIQKKSAPFEFKAGPETGTFEALVSVFGNIDAVGDRILPGAYTKTLEQWRASGDPIPVIFNHDWGTPDAHIGVAHPKDVKQTPKGLVVKATLDVEDNPVAKQVYRLMKRRSLKEFSIGYRVPSGGEHQAEDGANDITEIDLVEVGPTLKGANSEAQLQAVKSALQETEPKPEPRSEEDLRREADKAERERIAEKLPEGVSESAYERKPDPVEALTAAVGILKTELQTVRDELAEQKKKAEEAKESTRTRSSDPLKTRSDQTVLEVQSDGASLRKPPETKREPTPVPLDEGDLKRRSRNTMLELLTGEVA